MRANSMGMLDRVSCASLRMDALELMSSRPTTTRHATRWTAVALLRVASMMGYSRSVTLPPIVEEQGSPPIPGKFVWHNLVTRDGQTAPEFYGGVFGWYGEVFYSAPIDRYAHGFYGHL